MCHKNTFFRASVLFLLFAASFVPASAQFAANRYAIILADPPVATRFESSALRESAAGLSYRQQIALRQRTLKTELAARNIAVTGSADMVLNAVFVAAPASRIDELKSLPGVLGVVPVRRYKRSLNRATQLLDAPAAWNALGGTSNAGKGIKIAILDSGIDQSHPAFQDSSLPMPAGYPICSGSDCAFTTNKVIVARSYVKQLATGSDPSNPAADSRPDDYSPRDRGGHGTAVASCAAGNTATGPAATIMGMAPKAYLGNYKIYGSPEVNDFTTDDVIITALNDAIHDGMDIISFSTGGPAFSGPLDTGSACGNDPGVPCDLSAMAFENAAKAGTVIVAAAGNSGYDGNLAPTFNTIGSPANAPSVIAAGATTNSHTFIQTVQVPGGPSNLQNIVSNSGDATLATGSISAPLRDVTSLGNDGLACTALPAGSLTGAFALIQRGTCTFDVKAVNAVTAGAVGVIFYMADSSPLLGISVTDIGIPETMISLADGTALKTYIAQNPGHAVIINPSGLEQSVSPFNQVVYFSSLGPTTGDAALKPDVVAVGTDVYMATQSYDPLGELYSVDGYSSASGTSFATPLTSGAAALVKQAHPNYSAAQIKSALVNFASQDVTQDDSGDIADTRYVGGGKVDAGAAVAATVTSSPASLSFGSLVAGALPLSRQLQIVNAGSSAVTLSASFSGTSGTATLAVDKTSLPLAAGGSATLTVTLSGTLPAAGVYSGALVLQGSGVTLRIPYLYLVTSGTIANFIWMSGDGFDGTVSQVIPDGIVSFKLIDQFGLPIVGAPIAWSQRGGGTLSQASTVTDRYGIGYAVAKVGATPGTYTFFATVGGTRYSFSGTARAVPNVTKVVEGASFDATRPVAPGSYITLGGTGLSDTTSVFPGSGNTPLAIDYVLVTFDVPSAGVSFPGHLTYVSPTQVNVQVPWELQGYSSAQVKVIIDFTNGNVVSVPLADFSPGFFGNGTVAALDTNYQVIGTSNPAQRGQIVQMFGNGLGPVTNQPKSGEPALSSPLSETKTKPVVTIGGLDAPIQFSGLAPGFAGLYQVNVTVPSGLAPGTYPVLISIGSLTSNASNMTVR